MDSSEVSTELWERIIDLVGIDSNRDPIAYYPAIRTCCLVCSLWLPRSQYNLYRAVTVTETLTRTGLNRVHCLARTVRERSDLAHLIQELQIRPITLGRAVPLVIAAGQGSWASSMVSLRSLKLIGVGWYPVLYSPTISHFLTPLHLEIRRVAFDAASHLFHLIWSFPHLVSLTLDQVTMRKLSHMHDVRLCSTRLQMSFLTELSISVRSLCSKYGRMATHASIGNARRRGTFPASRSVWQSSSEAIPGVLFEELA